jgi:hypothetical protein
MTIIKKMIGALVVALALTSPSFAIQFVDGGLITPYYLSVSGNSSYGDTFDLVGFNPLTQQINSAVARFAFSDGYQPDSALEKVDISLGGILLINDQEVNGTHQNIPSSYAWYSASLTAPMIADLSVDGSISYLVNLLNLPQNTDNTWLKGAKITVQVSNRVPDGGTTVSMLGLAMVGLWVLRRRTSLAM